MTEVTPRPLKTQGFRHFLILLFYDHPALTGGDFLRAENHTLGGGHREAVTPGNQGEKTEMKDR